MRLKFFQNGRKLLILYAFHTEDIEEDSLTYQITQLISHENYLDGTLNSLHISKLKKIMQSGI